MTDAVVIAADDESPPPEGTDPVTNTKRWAGGAAAPPALAGWAVRYWSIPCEKKARVSEGEQTLRRGAERTLVPEMK